MPDFWPTCGYRLLTRGGDGRLTVTDDFLRSYLTRPELAPIPESCRTELALHDALLANPRRAVAPAESAAIADVDARENYGIWLRFRARLLAAGSLEAAYVGLFHGAGVDVPPQFVHELTQVLLRHILGEGAAPLEARAAEMLFRTQKIAVTDDGAVMAADETTVELFASTAGFGSLGELLAQNKTPARSVDVDVLGEANAASYWDRDERHDFSIALNRGQPALDALTRVLEKWVRHFLSVDVTIQHERAIDDERMGRLLCLFRLEFADPADMRPAVAGRPVYLAMAMDREHRLKLKPQNLLVNLPLARAQ